MKKHYTNNMDKKPQSYYIFQFSICRNAKVKARVKDKNNKAEN